MKTENNKFGFGNLISVGDLYEIFEIKPSVITLSYKEHSKSIYKYPVNNFKSY